MIVDYVKQFYSLLSVMEVPGSSFVKLNEGNNEGIRSLLRQYHTSASNTLSGPKDTFTFNPIFKTYDKCATKYISFKNEKRLWKRKYLEDNGIVKHFELHSKNDQKLFEHLPTPISSARDDSECELYITSLHDEYISCFIIGGERRLCLPQVLNSVLRGVSIADIHSACDDLHIFCSTCSDRQLAVLKKGCVLPPSATQCGLISKTDAERLCAQLLCDSGVYAGGFSRLKPSKHRWPSSNGVDDGSAAGGDATTVHVVHRCFGKCRGVLHPHLYDTPGACCILCAECGRRFSPRRFVAHSHGRRERRMVHWGFDGDNWRHYLQLCRRHKHNWADKCRALDQFKSKFTAVAERSGELLNDQLEKRPRFGLLAALSPLTAASAAAAAASVHAPAAAWCAGTRTAPPAHSAVCVANSCTDSCRGSGGLCSSSEKATDLSIGSATAGRRRHGSATAAADETTAVSRDHPTGTVAPCQPAFDRTCLSADCRRPVSPGATNNVSNSLPATATAATAATAATTTTTAAAAIATADAAAVATAVATTTAAAAATATADAAAVTQLTNSSDLQRPSSIVPPVDTANPSPPAAPSSPARNLISPPSPSAALSTNVLHSLLSSPPPLPLPPSPSAAAAAASPAAGICLQADASAVSAREQCPSSGCVSPLICVSPAARAAVKTGVTSVGTQTELLPPLETTPPPATTSSCSCCVRCCSCCPKQQQQQLQQLLTPSAQLPQLATAQTGDHVANDSNAAAEAAEVVGNRAVASVLSAMEQLSDPMARQLLVNKVQQLLAQVSKQQQQQLCDTGGEEAPSGDMTAVSVSPPSQSETISDD